jgi:hypothetical protein
MENTKFGFKEVFKPTPTNMVKLGNALMGASAFVAGTFMFLGDHKEIAIAFMVLGAVGKFISLMFSNTPAPSDVVVAEPVEEKVVQIERPLNEPVEVDLKTTIVFECPAADDVTSKEQNAIQE